MKRVKEYFVSISGAYNLMKNITIPRVKKRSTGACFIGTVIKINIIVCSQDFMRIGKKELNEDEAKWATQFADSIANESCKRCVSALNAKFEIDDIKDFLVSAWSAKSKPVFEEPEPEPIDDDDEDDGDF